MPSLFPIHRKLVHAEASIALRSILRIHNFGRLTFLFLNARSLHFLLHTMRKIQLAWRILSPSFNEYWFSSVVPWLEHNLVFDDWQYSIPSLILDRVTNSLEHSTREATCGSPECVSKSNELDPWSLGLLCGLRSLEFGDFNIKECCIYLGDLEKFEHRNFQTRASDRSNYCSFEMNSSRRDGILGDKHNLLHHQHVGSLSKSTAACTLTLLDNVVGYESLTLW